MDAPVSAPPVLMLGARSTELPHTSNVMPGPACTVSALLPSAMCEVQFVVRVTYSTPARACAAGRSASANAPAAVNAVRDAFAPRHLSTMLIMESPPVAPINDATRGSFSPRPAKGRMHRRIADDGERRPIGEAAAFAHRRELGLPERVADARPVGHLRIE